MDFPDLRRELQSIIAMDEDMLPEIPQEMIPVLQAILNVLAAERSCDLCQF